MLMMVGVVVEVRYDEVDLVHEMMASVKEVDTAEELGRITGGFQPGGELEPGESLYVPITVDFRSLMLKSFGAHDVQVAVDGHLGTHLTFYVRPSP